MGYVSMNLEHLRAMMRQREATAYAQADTGHLQAWAKDIQREFGRAPRR